MDRFIGTDQELESEQQLNLKSSMDRFIARPPKGGQRLRLKFKIQYG